MEKWGIRLQRAMKARGHNKSLALAVTLGVNESTISRWKQSGNISIDNAIKLVNALDISLDWLFLNTTKQKSHFHDVSNEDIEHAKLKLKQVSPATLIAIVKLIDTTTETTQEKIEY